MSGFNTIIGFTMSFLVIMGLFVTAYFTFMTQIATQENLFRENVDQTVNTLREEFDVEGIYLNSGRVQLDISNLGTDDLGFKNSYGECFEYFVSGNYITDDNVMVKNDESLGGNFHFIDSGKSALVYLFYNSIVPGSEDVRLVSCLGNYKDFKLEPDTVNWFDDDFYMRENLNVVSDVVDRVDEEISYSLTSADYNFSFFENPKFSYICPIRNFEILNLPFDDFKQNLKDYSMLDNSVVLGNSGSLESEDPAIGGGVILKGMNFDAGDFLKVNNLEFDDLDHTVSFWFKSNFTLDSSSVKRTFFNVGNEYFIGHNFLGSGEFGFYRYNGASLTFDMTSLTSTFNPNKWYNIIIVLDNSDTHKLFVNGVLEDSTTSSLSSNANTGLTFGVIEG